jgi:Uma2 family endonuclease
MTTATKQTEHSTIEYPDDDGELMSDNTLQFKWIVVIKEGLEALYRHNPHVFVAGNLLWYPVEGDPAICSAPDALVAFDRPKGRRGSYKQWEEDNIAPQVVVEVRSPGNRPDEMTRKFQFYEKHGVLEYYLYDPDTGKLEGWMRVGDHLEQVPVMMGFVSPLLGVRFEPSEGADNLKIVGPDGEPFLTYAEIIEQRMADREHLKVERQLKEAERRRADEERQRAERYAAKLRELGIEPD